LSRTRKNQPIPIAQALTGIPDRAVLQLHHKRQYVPTAALAEAMEDVLLQVDVETRAVLAAVNRTRADEPTGFLLVELREQSVSR
jgi:hypothetical protein